jgi:thiol:disulfide interchange protein DsbA
MHMLKPLASSFVAVLLLAFAGAVLAQKAAPGKDYEVIASPQKSADPKKIEIIEFFSYGCIHCADFEPALEAWLKDKPADVTFRPIPLVFHPSWRPLAKLYYALELLGELPRLHAKVFEAVHKQNQQLTTDEAVAKWAASQGIDPAKFQDAYNAFGIDAKIGRGADLARAFGVTGTPTIGVNGKYMTSPSMTAQNSSAPVYPRFFQVLDEVIVLARGGPAPAAAPEKQASDKPEKKKKK